MTLKAHLKSELLGVMKFAEIVGANYKTISKAIQRNTTKHRPLYEYCLSHGIEIEYENWEDSAKPTSPKIISNIDKLLAHCHKVVTGEVAIKVEDLPEFYDKFSEDFKLKIKEENKYRKVFVFEKNGGWI